VHGGPEPHADREIDAISELLAILEDDEFNR
jgi:hypothetical protein